LFGEVMCPKRRVVGRVGGKLCRNVGKSVPLCHSLGRSGKKLQEAARIGRRNRRWIKRTFLACNRVGKCLARARYVCADRDGPDWKCQRRHITSLRKGRLSDPQSQIVIASTFSPCCKQR